MHYISTITVKGFIMFKMLLASKKYKLDDVGNIMMSDGSACTLPVKNKRVRISLYGVVRWYKLSWLSALATYAVRLPTALHDRLYDIDYVAVPAIGSPFNNTVARWYHKKPIYFKDDFRIIPGYYGYAVNIAGDVVDVTTGKTIPHAKYIYRTVSVYVPEYGHYRNAVVHRLVALAWVKTHDISEYWIVNHKDGNKLNCHADNLEWVTHKENSQHAAMTGLKSDTVACMVRDTGTDMVHRFHSVNAACEYMGIVIRNIVSMISPGWLRLIKGRWEFKVDTDTTPWLSLTTTVTGKPRTNRYEITDSDGNVEVVMGNHALVRRYKLWNVGTGAKFILSKMADIHPTLTVELIRPGLKYGPYQSLDTLSGTVQEHLTSRV